MTARANIVPDNAPLIYRDKRPVLAMDGTSTGESMSRFRKIHIYEAHQWYKNGDHPEDACETLTGADGESFLSEGKVVRRFRRPDVDGDSPCPECGEKFHDHGVTRAGQLEFSVGGYHTVCPGDWVIKAAIGDTYYPENADYFQKIYEPVSEVLS